MKAVCSILLATWPWLGFAAPTATAADARQQQPSSRRTPLTITEIMYHPGPGPEPQDLEYIELFNTEPVPHDLSGWQVTGAVDYVFPAGTILSGRSYLLVAADPTALTARYGTTNLVGPFAGFLPNDRGTLRLRDQLGTKLIEIQYADQYPWPVAADGAGHALQLTQPDFGESSPRAWAASGLVGGSPGRIDPSNASPLREVVLNEVLSSPAHDQEEFVELLNGGAQPVDVSRCTLSDTAATPKFRIPDGTVLPPGGIAAFTRTVLGFSLSGQGDEIYLSSPDGSFVLDAIRFGASETGVALGRYPDGAPAVHELSSPTPSSSNAPLLIRGVVINEIMYHPLSGDERDEYVELHNRSATPVDLSHWQFTDGISFVFPAGTTLGPHGFLVVAKDAARLMTRHANLTPETLVGDYTGSLSDRGERLALARPRDPRSPREALLLVDEVSYGDGDDWGRWTDGGGSSLELVDPASDNRLAMNWRGSDESQKGAHLWTHLAATRTLAGGHGAADELHLFMMGAGECLVDELVVQAAGAPARLTEGFEAGASGWQFWGNHVRSSHEPGQGYQSARSLHLRASGPGDMTGGNSKGEADNPTYDRVTVPLGAGLVAGNQVTIQCRARWLQGSPGLVLGLKGLWMEAAGLLTVPTDLGTPGRSNSRYLPNAGPALWDVAHSPAVPPASRGVVVTCRAHDPQGVASLSLHYRVDPSPAVRNIAMRDDGLEGDLLAGDGLYSARLPGHRTGTLLAFTLAATDTLGATTQFPPPGPVGAPTRECLVRFGEMVPAGTLGTYRMWMTDANVQTWNSRPPRSNEPLDATFVSGTERVIYNASARYRGNWRPYNGPAGSAPCAFAVDFPASDRFLGDNEVKLDLPGQGGGDIALQRERHSSWFAKALGLPASNVRFVRVFFNGSDRGINGVLNDKETPGRAFVESVYGDEDPLYFENTRFHSDQVNYSPLRDIRNPDGSRKQEFYRWYVGRVPTKVPSDDYQPLYALIEALNTADPQLYTLKTQSRLDLDSWMGVFAVNHIIGNGDSISWRNSKNTGIYAPPLGRARIFLIDTDQSFGIGSNRGPQEDLFTCNDAVIARLLHHPPFRRIFWRYVDEAVNGPMQPARHDPVVDAWFDALLAEGATPNADSTATIKTYVRSRRAYLGSLLTSVNVPFRLTLNQGRDFSTDANRVSLIGEAPVTITTLLVNGVPYPASWDTVSQWRVEVVLQPGANALAVEGLDRHGVVLDGAWATIQITFTGTAAWPALRISEWMADNTGSVRDPVYGQASDWFELYNPTASAVALHGWYLSDTRSQPLQFRIPTHPLLQPAGYLIVWADGQADRNSSDRPDLHANFKLDKQGEVIALSAPDGTLIDVVQFGPQAPDISSGRAAAPLSHTTVLAWPTPGGPNSAPPDPPTFQQLQHTETSVALRLNTVPNFTYSIEVQDQAGATNWSPLGLPVRALDTTLLFPDAAPRHPQRFYRALRTP
ncbi:MAG: hypothetical protein FJ387_22285 [Verrucomicrobia bacterium]|nr:hypothetical protein [Verrucomicrobiota bacterium]